MKNKTIIQTIISTSQEIQIRLTDFSEEFWKTSLSGQGHDELFNIAGIKIDEEKALIALMIYILYKNGADVKLLLGLGYLLI